MTKKIYRTANGKMVDLGALQLQNETVRAVGNMGVNARGDLVDGRNKSINSRNQQVAKQYKRQVKSANAELPVASSRKHAEAMINPSKTPSQPVVPKSIPDPVIEKTATTATGGLAAAIAKARSISQEPLAPAPSRNNDGPVKI